MPAVGDVESMKLQDAAYIAGFFDGEGCVTIVRRRPKPTASYWLLVGLTNTDLQILLWIQSIVGGKICNKTRRSIKHAPGFELRITRKQEMYNFLIYIQPFVRIKKRQVETALAFLELKKVKMVMSESRGKTWPLMAASPEDAVTRETFKTIMNDLNRRGPLCLQ